MGFGAAVLNRSIVHWLHKHELRAIATFSRHIYKPWTNENCGGLWHGPAEVHVGASVSRIRIRIGFGAYYSNYSTSIYIYIQNVRGCCAYDFHLFGQQSHPMMSFKLTASSRENGLNEQVFTGGHT